jgi:hypothetical protein
MKKVLVTVLGLGLAATPVIARMGSVVTSFPSPTTNAPWGLARSNDYLYVLVYSSPNRVYLLRWTNGSVLSSWITPRADGNRGLAYSWGGHVWIGCYQNDTVYDCVDTTGSVRTSWSAGHDPYGLAPNQIADGGYGTTALYVRDSSPSYVWLQSLTNGSVQSSFSIAHSSASDFAYDHHNLTLWGPYGTNIYGYNRYSGLPVLSFQRPANASVYGLAYHGYYLWVACSNRYIYVVHCPREYPAVQPATLGRVKALFR